MKQPKTALFDFDGVVVDTEPIYDLFWNDAAKRYGLGIDNFADIIKGTTLPYILEKYFSGYTEEFRQMVTKESTEYEKTMPLPPMPGSIEFIRMLKEHGVQIGLVTSSDNAKVKRAFRLLHLDNLFDTLVTADRITQGKPDPMCYLLAAKDLNVSPEDCIVFDCVFIQSQFFQRIEYLPESTVNTCNGSEIVTYTLRLCHFRIGIGANQQAVQRLILV